MGLDVYLCHSSNWEETQRIAALDEELSERLWKSIDDEIKDTLDEHRAWVRQQYENEAQKHGLRLSEGMFLGLDDMSKDIEIPSKLHPGHLFKIGRWRSSYNAGGINNVLDKFGLPTLHDLAGHHSDEYWQENVDWQALAENTKKALAELRPLAALGLTVMPGKDPFSSEVNPTPRQALEWAAEELSKESPFDNGFSNHRGSFFPKTLPLAGVIGDWLVLKDADGYDWYVQALEIVMETAEYVLSQPDPHNYRLRWSG